MCERCALPRCGRQSPPRRRAERTLSHDDTHEDGVRGAVRMQELVLCTVLLAVGTVVGDDGLGTREAAVRDVFREMLHIKPPSGQPQGKPLSAPRHMVELYQQYSRRQLQDTATTTIRNILPSHAGAKELVVFNVSTVRDEEEVRLAQLQLNRRRLHQRHQHRRLLAPPYRVRLYQVCPGRLAPLASVPVPMVHRSAWEAVDITAALKELLLDPRPSRRLLAVRFESPTGKRIPPAHFLRGVPDTPFAFLVVFTEDSEENAVAEDGSQPSPRPPVHSHAFVQKLQQGKHGALFREEEDNSPPIIPLLETMNDRRLLSSNSSTSTTNVLPTTATPKNIRFENLTSHNVSGRGLFRLREVRSIIDNQLPDEDEATDSQGPKMFPENMLTSKTDIPRFHDSLGRKPKKGKKGKRKKGKKQKYSQSLDSWQNVYKNPGEGAGTCTVRKMTVNFAEIGWGEWIISPDKFDANYCTGSCRFPLTKAVKPSNHATLQSLVHALGHNPLIPAPACVPHQMSAITLLYFDETLNVVLKNYPSMIVDSCACR